MISQVAFQLVLGDVIGLIGGPSQLSPIYASALQEIQPDSVDDEKKQ